MGIDINTDAYEQYRFLKNVDFIGNALPKAVLYEQLAEEASELAQAALKKARKLRGENPTPKTDNEIDSDIDEELSDLYLVSMILDRSADMETCKFKANRWVHRLRWVK